MKFSHNEKLLVSGISFVKEGISRNLSHQIAEALATGT
jgi:hypothetical protein